MGEHDSERYVCHGCGYVGDFEDFNAEGQCPECGEVENVLPVDEEGA